LLNLNFKERTKAVAFVDDLLLAIRGESVRAAENYWNGGAEKNSSLVKKEQD